RQCITGPALRRAVDAILRCNRRLPRSSCRRERTLGILAMPIRLLPLLILVLATLACTPQRARETTTSSSAPDVGATFAQLNVLRRQSRALKTPLAEYAF